MSKLWLLGGVVVMLLGGAWYARTELAAVRGLLVASFGGEAPCRLHSDPRGLANGQNVLFIDRHNCNCQDPSPSNLTPRQQALNPATPWCHFHALNEFRGPGHVLAAGDTVYLRGSDYTDNGTVTLATSGTESERIRITSYPQETAVIRGGTLEPRWLLQVLGSYVTLDSLQFVGHENVAHGKLYQPLMVLVKDSAGVEVIHSAIRDFVGSDGVGGQALASGRGLQLENVRGALVDTVQVRCVENAGAVVVDQLQDTDGIACSHCEQTIIKESSGSLCQGHIIAVRDSVNVTVQDSDITNVLRTAVAFFRTSASTIEGNRIHDFNTAPATSDTQGHGIYLEGVKATSVFNNVVYHADFLATGIAAEGGEGNAIYHNTLQATGAAGVSVSTDTATTVFNNIIAALPLRIDGQVPDVRSASRVHTNLLFDPQFRNPARADFRLRETSPAIGAAQCPSSLRDDFAGAQRPQGACTLGALEYPQGEPPVFTEIGTRYSVQAGKLLRVPLAAQSSEGKAVTLSVPAGADHFPGATLVVPTP
jgi:hypothetical protein